MKESLRKYKNAFITVFLGALGSGLWTAFININSYLSKSITNFFLNISSSFDEMIFRQVAKNNLALTQTSTFILLIILITLIFTLIILILLPLLTSRAESHLLEANQSLTRLGSSLAVEGGKNYIKQDFDVEYNSLFNDYKNNEKRLNRLKKVSKILAPIMLTSLILSATYRVYTTQYIDDCIQYFNYLLKVNASNLDEKSERIYISKFAQIRNGDDYKKIVIELEKLALDNKLVFVVNPSVRKDISKDHPSIELR